MKCELTEEDAEIVSEEGSISSIFGTFSGKGLFTAAESEDWLSQSDFGSYERVSPEEFERIFRLATMAEPGAEPNYSRDPIDNMTEQTPDSQG